METKNDVRGDLLDSLFFCLANGERRHLLRIVLDRAPDPITRKELATALAAWNHKKPEPQVTTEERRNALTALHHTHLPKLEDADLIEGNPEGNTITVTDHPAYDDTGIRKAIATDESADIQSRDDLFTSLADGRRRTILDVLSHQYQPIRMETLAREVLAREQSVKEQEVAPEDVNQLLISFYHHHLPLLAEADLIEYDIDARTVAYTGHPLLQVSWMHSWIGPDFRPNLTKNSREQGVLTIEGREKIVSYGQSLCDEVEGELFMMFTTTGLLEAGCFARIEQAIDRGVDVYLGTCDRAVREFVQENFPEIVLWEPQANWLDLPVQEENVGRLVFADREAILLGTLGEKNDEGIYREQAIVGEGPKNALVVLLRQMLGSHLEQFDEDSDELESELPF